jgi:hypothetical protein
MLAGLRTGVASVVVLLAGFGMGARSASAQVIMTPGPAVGVGVPVVAPYRAYRYPVYPTVAPVYAAPAYPVVVRRRVLRPRVYAPYYGYRYRGW